MADLDSAFARALVRGAHQPRVLEREGHGLFLVHVLACMDCVHEMQAMQMLRSGDQHTVQSFVIEHLPVIHVCLHTGDVSLCLFEPLRIDVAHGSKVGVRAINRFTRDLAAAVAVADDAEPNAIVCTEN